MQNFALLTPVKFRGGMGEIRESVLRVQPRFEPVIYFWWGVSRPYGGL